jgi:hypothetical protein
MRMGRGSEESQKLKIKNQNDRSKCKNLERGGRSFAPLRTRERIPSRLEIEEILNPKHEILNESQKSKVKNQTDKSKRKNLERGARVVWYLK